MKFSFPVSITHFSGAHFCAHVCAGLLALLGFAGIATADTFLIDSNQSSLSITGSIQGSTFVQQGAGSMTTRYSGSIEAAQTGSTIQFTGLSAIVALTNGIWTPGVGGLGGSAPADYGASASLLSGLINAVAALRTIQFDVTSTAITVSASQFNAAGLTFTFPTNITSTLDYQESGSLTGHGSKILTGNATNNVAVTASLTTVGPTQTLTIPVHAVFTFTILSPGDTLIGINGQIVATRTTAAAALKIDSITRLGQAVTLQWQNTASQLFSVLSSTNLQTWQTNATGVTSGTTAYSWTGTNTAGRAFYRLMK